MTVLHQVLVHVRAGRWNEAHKLVQSDATPLAAWLPGCTASCTFRRVIWKMPSTGTTRPTGTSAAEATWSKNWSVSRRRCCLGMARHSWHQLVLFNPAPVT